MPCKIQVRMHRSRPRPLGFFQHSREFCSGISLLRVVPGVSSGLYRGPVAPPWLLSVEGGRNF